MLLLEMGADMNAKARLWCGGVMTRRVSDCSQQDIREYTVRGLSFLGSPI